MYKLLPLDAYLPVDQIMCACGEQDCYRAIESGSTDGQRIFLYEDISLDRAGVESSFLSFTFPPEFGIYKREEIAPLDAPDAPGWWAFEGVLDGDKNRFKAIYNVFEKNGALVLGLFVEEDNYEWGDINSLSGHWWQIETPWGNK